MAREIQQRHELTPEQITEASRYSVEVHWSPEDQVYIAEIPELNGARTHGNSPTEAVEMVIEVAAIWIEAARKRGWPIPAPRIAIAS